MPEIVKCIRKRPLQGTNASMKEVVEFLKTKGREVLNIDCLSVEDPWLPLTTLRVSLSMFAKEIIVSPVT